MSATNVVDGLLYTRDHEWARQESDGSITVGITDYAQDALGDITFLELPAVGTKLETKGSFGVVESVKTYSDLYAPVAGEVLAVNQSALDDPASINTAPYGDAWLVRLKPANPAELGELLSAAAYRELLASAG